MSIKEQIEKTVEEKLQEVYDTILQNVMMPISSNFNYMNTITTPNEVFAWAEKNKCPVCKSSLSQKSDTVNTFDWDDHYTSEFSCIDPKDEYHYAVVLEFEDPKDIYLSEETIMDFYDDEYSKEYHLEIKHSSPIYRPSQPIEARLKWWEWQEDFSRYDVINKEIRYDKEFEEIVDHKMFDPNKYNEQKWRELVKTIIFYR